jgi:hypothetical protein
LINGEAKFVELPILIVDLCLQKIVVNLEALDFPQQALVFIEPGARCRHDAVDLVLLLLRLFDSTLFGPNQITHRLSGCESRDEPSA